MVQGQSSYFLIGNKQLFFIRLDWSLLILNLLYDSNKEWMLKKTTFKNVILAVPVK